MTTHFVPAPWRERLKLSNLWRQRLDEAPAAVLPPLELPEEAPQVGHIYMSNEPEPGQTTTALGRHHTPDLLPPKPAADRLLAQPTQVIPRLAVAQQAALDQADPPLFLQTLHVMRERYVRPAIEASDGDETTAWATTGQPAKEDGTDA